MGPHRPDSRARCGKALYLPALRRPVQRMPPSTGRQNRRGNGLRLLPTGAHRASLIHGPCSRARLGQKDWAHACGWCGRVPRDVWTGCGIDIPRMMGGAAREQVRAGWGEEDRVVARAEWCSASPRRLMGPRPSSFALGAGAGSGSRQRPFIRNGRGQRLDGSSSGRSGKRGTGAGSAAGRFRTFQAREEGWPEIRGHQKEARSARDHPTPSSFGGATPGGRDGQREPGSLSRRAPFAWKTGRWERGQADEGWRVVKAPDARSEGGRDKVRELSRRDVRVERVARRTSCSTAAVAGMTRFQRVIGGQIARGAPGQGASCSWQTPGKRSAVDLPQSLGREGESPSP